MPSISESRAALVFLFILLPLGAAAPIRYFVVVSAVSSCAFFSREKGTFFEPITKLRVKTQNAISLIQKAKEGVRRPSLPMNDDVLRRLRTRIDNNNLEDVKKLNWVYISYVFGLRPSECDDVIKSPRIESHDGIPTLIVIQTKLTVVDESESEREKKIPVICEEQMKALDILKQARAMRPSPTWIDKRCKEDGKHYRQNQRYDLYCGRKGFIDFMLSKGQDIQQASIFAGHKSIDTTWT